MEYLEFPVEWAEAGRIVRQAEYEARREIEAKQRRA